MAGHRIIVERDEQIRALVAVRPKLPIFRIMAALNIPYRKLSQQLDALGLHGIPRRQNHRKYVWRPSRRKSLAAYNAKLQPKTQLAAGA